MVFLGKLVRLQRYINYLGDDLEEDLSDDLAVLNSYLEGMLERVKHNSATLRKFQAFEMRLLNLNSLSDMIDHILEDAKKYFDLDVISLCLIDEKAEIAKALHDDGYDCSLKKGLVLLDTKELVYATFGFTVRPYIGVYKESKYADFFSQQQQKPASIAITPLNRRGKYLGTLNLGSYHADRFVDNMATDFVEHLSSVVGVCLENNLNFEEIRRTSFIDVLTGVNNRRFLEQRIGEELDRCQRNADPISCLFFDIDYFKSVNDKYGHQAGDQVLSLVAMAIKTQLRNNDVLARYGGEEFVALLSNTNEAKALEIAERIRKIIQELVVELDDTLISVTISIGLSTYVPDTISMSSVSEVATRLIQAADSALYNAKHSGRNRVEKGGIFSDQRVVNKTAAL